MPTIPPMDNIQFRQAQWWDDDSPLVVVLCSYHGDEVRLRMDIDKRRFIDHLDDPRADNAVQERVLPIWEIIAKERNWILSASPAFHQR
jgi:hypothetical protein